MGERGWRGGRKTDGGGDGGRGKLGAGGGLHYPVFLRIGWGERGGDVDV